MLTQIKDSLVAEVEKCFAEPDLVVSTPRDVDITGLEASKLLISKPFYESSSNLHFARSKEDDSVLVVAKMLTHMVHPSQDFIKADEYSMLTAQQEM